MPMSSGMHARFHAPPHDHAMLARDLAAADLVADALLGKGGERAIPCKFRHLLASSFGLSWSPEQKIPTAGSAIYGLCAFTQIHRTDEGVEFRPVILPGNERWTLTMWFSSIGRFAAMCEGGLPLTQVGRRKVHEDLRIPRS